MDSQIHKAFVGFKLDQNPLETTIRIYQEAANR